MWITYGDRAWFLIYQADVRMRSEEFERIRRRLKAAHDPSAPAAAQIYDPEHPWSSVFSRAVHRADQESAAFWQAEVREKAYLFLSRVQPAQDLTRDNTVQDLATPPGDKPRRRGASRTPPKTPRQRGPARRSERGGRGGGTPTGKGGRQPAGVGKDGGNRRDYCRNWNNGHCQEPCPAGRVHKCEVCDGSHRSIDCDRKPPKGQGKGGKGQGQK